MARLKPAKTVSGDHQPPLCSKTFHGSPVPRPKPKLLFLAFGWAAFLPSPFSVFLPFPKRDHQPLFTLFPPAVHLHLTKSHNHRKASPTSRAMLSLLLAPRTLLSAAFPLLSMCFLRGNCVHFLSRPREKTGTALDTKSGSARAQLCHLVYITSPLHTSVSSSVRWGGCHQPQKTNSDKSESTPLRAWQAPSGHCDHPPRGLGGRQDTGSAPPPHNPPCSLTGQGRLLRTGRASRVVAGCAEAEEVQAVARSSYSQGQGPLLPTNTSTTPPEPSPLYSVEERGQTHAHTHPAQLPSPHQLSEPP